MWQEKSNGFQEGLKAVAYSRPMEQMLGKQHGNRGNHRRSPKTAEVVIERCTLLAVPVKDDQVVLRGSTTCHQGRHKSAKNGEHCCEIHSVNLGEAVKFTVEQVTLTTSHHVATMVLCNTSFWSNAEAQQAWLSAAAASCLCCNPITPPPTWVDGLVPPCPQVTSWILCTAHLGASDGHVEVLQLLTHQPAAAAAVVVAAAAAVM
jgi:hypothetical protein